MLIFVFPWCFSGFGLHGKIEFRDADDLDSVIYTHSVAPYWPGRMCTGATPSTLLYVDTSTAPFQVHCLDLSGSEPKPAAGKSVIHIRQYGIEDMCCMKDGDKQLLVVASRYRGLYAYNMGTDQLEWKVEGKLPGLETEMDACGVTTDGRGHLFVADYNYGNIGIQVFLTAGWYLIKDENLGSPARIQWCNETSSLLTAFRKNDKWNFHVIRIQH